MIKSEGMKDQLSQQRNIKIQSKIDKNEEGKVTDNHVLPLQKVSSTFSKQIIQIENIKSQDEQSLQKKRKKSFSPIKRMKMLQKNKNIISQQQNQQLQRPLLLEHQIQNSEGLKDANLSIKNPFTYLLQHIPRGLQTTNKRSDEQIQLIMKLIQDNQIFIDLSFEGNMSNSSKNLTSSCQFAYQSMLKDVCNKAVLIWSETPNIAQTKSNQIYLILEGKTFEYIHNVSASIKLKIHQNNDYIMVRKLIENDYFITVPSVGPKTNKIQNKSSQKYQLMVDQKTLMVKISEQLFIKYFQSKMQQRTKNIMHFLKKISLFENLPSFVFQQLSKFIKLKKLKQGQSIISIGEKSKEIYFLKKGKVEFKLSASNSIQNKHSQQSTSILGEYDVFGMDTLHTLKSISQITIDYSAFANSDCELYCIDKRILAIVISSFQKQLKIQQKIIRSINLNTQIKGQNYLSYQQKILTLNAQRIKTSQKKIRDVKLKSFSRKQSRQVNTYIPQKDRIDQKRAQIKSQSKLRSSAGFNFVRNKNMKSQISIHNWKQSTDSRFWQLKDKFESKYSPQKEKITSNYTNYVLPVMQEVQRNDSLKKSVTLFSNSSLNQFQKVQRKSFQFLGRNNSVTQMLDSIYNKDQSPPKQMISTSRSFVPKIKNKLTMIQSSINLGKMQSDVIKSYIQKKLKRQLIKKTTQILQKKCQTQRNSTKSIKNIFPINSYSPSKKLSSIQKLKKKPQSQQQITEQLFNRMTNMKDYPLLCKIETERRKIQNVDKDNKQKQSRKKQKDEKQAKKNIKSNINKIIILTNQSVSNNNANINGSNDAIIRFSSEGSGNGGYENLLTD